MDPVVIREHAHRGSRWLIDEQKSSGEWKKLDDPKLDAYYKSAWTLSMTGNIAEAHRLLTFVERRFMNRRGDFIRRESDILNNVQHLYPNTYIIAGAAATHRYEIATPALRFLKTRQDPDSGGFYSQQNVPDEENRINTMTTAAAGMGLLAGGEVAEASRAGDFLNQLAHEQPTPDERFYTTVKADGQLLTDTGGENHQWWLQVDTSEENQCWYAVGLPLAFAVELAEATGKERYFDLAEWLFDFLTQCIEPWTGGSSGKAGWGCSMLYRITGEEQYRQAVNTVAEYLISRQSDNGGWIPQSASPDDPISNLHFDTTAEFSLWLKLMAENLAGRTTDKSES